MSSSIMKGFLHFIFLSTFFRISVAVSLDCIVPQIDGGYLNAQRWNGREWYLQVIPPGEKLPDESRAHLYCGGKWSKWIRCVKGEWNKPVTCGNQANCTNPPRIRNGKAEKDIIAHGEFVKYSCDEGFTIQEPSSIKCQFGKFEGNAPTCKKTTALCKIPEFLDGIFGTKQVEARYYGYYKREYFLKAEPGSTWEEGSTLLVRCDNGYALKGTANSSERQVTCRRGSWYNLVECLPANCTNPPRIRNGKAEKDIIAHGEFVKYSCDEGFTIQEPSSIKCQFGKFEGNAPTCKKTTALCKIPEFLDGIFGTKQVERRYYGYYKREYFLKAEPGSTWEEGSTLLVRCDNGYALKGTANSSERQVTCRRGSWYNLVECLPVSRDCIVPRIDGGDVLAHQWNGRYWELQELRPGEKLRDESEAHLYCGKKWSNWMKCVKGEWSTPVTCGRQDDPRATFHKPSADNGASRGRPTIHPIINSPARNEEEMAHSTPKPLNKPENSEDIPMTTILEDVSTIQSSTGDTTSCILPQIPELLVAHSNFQRVFSGSEIPSGRDVFFSCKDIGKHIFKGLNKWSCENGNWSSTELPSCTNTTGTYPIILLSKSDSGVPVIGQEGHIFLQHPNQQRFLCLSANGKGRVIWEVGSSASVEINTTDLFRSNVHILVLDLSTNNEDGVVEIKCTSELNGDSRSLIINVKASKIPTEMLIKPEVTFPQITTTQLPSTELPLADFSSTSSTEIGIRTSSSAPTASPDATVSRVEEETPFFGTEVGDGITELPNITTGTSQPKPCVFWLRDESLEGFLPNGVHVYTGDNVSHGEVVMVHCRHIGIQRLKGAKSIRCDNSRWQPIKTRFPPKCNNPQNSEDPVIFFDIPQNRYHIGPGGLLTILRSTTMELRCVSGANKWPTWALRRHWKFNQAHNEFENRRQTKVEIVNAQVEHSGVYTCKVGRKEHSIILDVVDGCDVSDVYDVVPIINVIPRLEYDRRFLSVGEKLELTCENNHVLQGNGTLVCLSRGMWSAPHPIKCEDPVIYFDISQNRYHIGPGGLLTILRSTTIHLRCVSGANKWPTWVLKRHWQFNQVHDDFENRKQTKVDIFNAQVEHSGVYACKVGKTVHSISLNVIDGCDVYDAYIVAPMINAIPRLKYGRRFLSVGEKLEVTCENNHVLQGNGTLVCLSGSRWSAPHPIKCVPGCPPPITDDPIMQIKGLKSGVYEFGDDLVFQCPSGFVLSTLYARIFCVSGKWSEKEIPRCINIDDIGRSNLH